MTKLPDKSSEAGHRAAEKPAQPENIWWIFVFWLLLASLAIPSLLPSGALGIVLTIAVLVLSGDRCAALWRRTRVGWAFVAAALVLGIVFSVEPGKSLKGIYDVLRGFGLFFVSYALVVHGAPAAVLGSAEKTYSSLAVLALAIAIGLGVHGSNFFLRDNQLLHETIGNLHEYANFCALITLVLGCLLAAGERFRPGLMAALAAACVATIATTSKGNFLALVFCLSFVLCYRRRSYLNLWLGALLLFLVTYVYALFFHADACMGGLCLGGTFTARKEIYHETLSLILQQLHFGYGVNTFKYVSGIQIRGEAFIMPHNIYLELLFSLGVIGSVLFLGGLVAVYRSGRIQKSGLNTESGQCRFPFLLGVVLFLYIALRGLVDMKFFAYSNFAIVSIALGLMCIKAPLDKCRSDPRNAFPATKGTKDTEEQLLR